MARKRKLPAGMILRGKTFHADFQHHGRRVRKRLSTDLAAAKQMLTELRSRSDRNDFSLLDNDCSWSELRDEFLRWSKQQLRTWKHYEADLDHFEQFAKPANVATVTPALMVSFREWRLDGGYKGSKVCPRSVNRETATIGRMFNLGVEWGRIASNPIAGMKLLTHDKPTKQRRALTLGEVHALLDNSPDDLRPVWRVMLATGIRKSELVNLQFSDVNWQDRTITIRPSVAKNKRRRDIPLDADTFELMQRLQREAKDRQPVPGNTPDMTERQRRNFTRDHVFTTQANTPLRYRLLRLFYGCCKKAGIADGKPGGSVDVHSLRVTFITLAIEGGASPKAVQEIVGHRTLEMTMNVYAKATDSAKRAAVDALGFAKASQPGHLLKFPKNEPECHGIPTTTDTSSQVVAG